LLITTPRHAFIIEITVVIELFESIIAHKGCLTTALAAAVSIDTLFIGLALVRLYYNLSYIYGGVDIV
jgi:hypothetical protein